MPIYAFRCDQCDHAFDRLQKLSDPDPETCPSCAAAAIRREVTAPAFRLAGAGWYETDFKKDGDRKRNLAEGGEGAAKPEAGKSDAAKPADKPADKAADKAADKPAAKPATAPAKSADA